MGANDLETRADLERLAAFIVGHLFVNDLRLERAARSS